MIEVKDSLNRELRASECPVDQGMVLDSISDVLHKDIDELGRGSNNAVYTLVLYLVGKL
jgi:hypothetical protein